MVKTTTTDPRLGTQLDMHTVTVVSFFSLLYRRLWVLEVLLQVVKHQPDIGGKLVWRVVETIAKALHYLRQIDWLRHQQMVAL